MLAIGGFFALRRYRRARISPPDVEPAVDPNGASELATEHKLVVEAGSADATGQQPTAELSSVLDPSVVGMEATEVPAHRLVELAGAVPPAVAELPVPADEETTASAAPAAARTQDVEQHPIAPPPVDEDEVARLLEKKARLDDQRRRLLALERLENEAEAVDKRLSQLRGHGSG